MSSSTNAAFDNGYNQAQQKYVPILKRFVEVWLNSIGDPEEEQEARQCSPIKEALEALEDAGILIPQINDF